jgi:hypothetical protein
MKGERRPPPRPTPRVPSSHELRKLADQAEKFEDDYAEVTRPDIFQIDDKTFALRDPPTPLRAGRPSSLPPDQKQEIRWIWTRGRKTVKWVLQGAALAAGGGIATWLWHMLHP